MVARSVAACVSPVVPEKVNAARPRKSAEIVHLYRLQEEIRRDAADLFWRTFDGDSLHAKCTDAAAFFGVDDRTVRGWLEGSTAPRGQVVAYAVAAMPERIDQIVRAA